MSDHTGSRNYYRRHGYGWVTPDSVYDSELRESIDVSQEVTDPFKDALTPQIPINGNMNILLIAVGVYLFYRYF